jgi:imidazole glycerol-phosphate synthase subunit HisH
MAERLVIVDYGSGNLRSVAKALERAATDGGLGTQIMVSALAADVRQADRIVLPGVGAFGHCAASLRAAAGVWEALQARVIEDGMPFLGICVGMQLMATTGHEHGDHEGLDWLAGDVVPLMPSDPALKIPHMGWNRLVCSADHPLTSAIRPDTFAYFVHSYQMRCADSAHLLASTDYGGTVSAIVGRDNLVGTQFHPEKSQRFGLDFLGLFLKWHA